MFQMEWIEKDYKNYPGQQVIICVNHISNLAIKVTGSFLFLKHSVSCWMLGSLFLFLNSTGPQHVHMSLQRSKIYIPDELCMTVDMQILMAVDFQFQLRYYFRSKLCCLQSKHTHCVCHRKDKSIRLDMQLFVCHLLLLTLKSWPERKLWLYCSVIIIKVTVEN